MAKKLVVYGAGNATILKIIAALNRGQQQWEVLGYLVDEEFREGPVADNLPVLGGNEQIASLTADGVYFVNNICSSALGRKITSDRLDAHGCQLANIVHPAVDLTYVDVGAGCVIEEGAIIGANVTLGKHCVLRSNSVVSHDCVIGDHVIINANASLSGHVHVAPNAYIGCGSTIRERLTIGVFAVVGAGSVVLTDVPEQTTVVGVPAKNIAEKVL